MGNNRAVQIVEKPDWVSWDSIHEVIWEAHAENRAKGIIMRYPSLSGDEIEQKIGQQGKMFVAIDGERVIGTAALICKKGKVWYNKGTYGYYCFDSVLPDYAGRGIFSQLNDVRIAYVKEIGLNTIIFDTHMNNSHMISIQKKHGFRRVALKFYTDHFNVVMAHWMNGCPVSEPIREFRYHKSYIKAKWHSISRRKM